MRESVNFILSWFRVSAPFPVRSVVPLCRTYIASTPLSVDVQVGNGLLGLSELYHCMCHDDGV